MPHYHKNCSNNRAHYKNSHPKATHRKLKKLSYDRSEKLNSAKFNEKKVENIDSETSSTKATKQNGLPNYRDLSRLSPPVQLLFLINTFASTMRCGAIKSVPEALQTKRTLK